VINKAETISQFQVTGPTDTGSPEVQIALATRNILHLTEHMKTHRFDYHSRRGLMRWVSHRNKMLRYLHKKHLDRYRSVIKALEIRDKF
jgi:small subunit ribosomal protein S15